MYVDGGVVGFRIWLIRAFIQVQRDIEKVDRFLVCLDGYFYPVDRRNFAYLFLYLFYLARCLIEGSEAIIPVKTDLFSDVIR